MTTGGGADVCADFDEPIYVTVGRSAVCAWISTLSNRACSVYSGSRRHSLGVMRVFPADTSHRILCIVRIHGGDRAYPRRTRPTKYCGG